MRKNFGTLGKTVFFACYHPAAALYNGGLRETIKKDFKKIPKILEIIEKDQEKEKLEKQNKTTQKKLF